MKKKLGFIIAFTMILTLLMSNVSFAVKPTEPNLNKAAKNQIVQQQKDEKEFYTNIKKLEKYVVRNNNGTFEITGNPKVNKDFLNMIKSNMDKVNELINQHYLTTDSNLRVYADSKYVLKGNTNKNKEQYVGYETFFEDAISKNVNISLGSKTISINFDNKAYAYNPPVGYYIYWWGWMLSMSEYATQNVVKAANTGAGAAAVAAVLSGAGIFSSVAAVPLGVISGVLWFGSGAIDWIDYIGGNKGVYIKGYWTGTFYIWHRY